MPATVLICDDERLLRELVSDTLKEGDYSVVEARDGEEALEFARGLAPDLIILDLTMPRRSGFDVLAELRRDPRLAAVPVIMLTARVQSADADAAAAAGADRFLTKPFSPRELAAVIGELLGADSAPVRTGEIGVADRSS